MKKKIDLNNHGTQLIVAGMAEKVEKDGMTARQVLEELKVIGEECFWALVDIEKETKLKGEKNR